MAIVYMNNCSECVNPVVGYGNTYNWTAGEVKWISHRNTSTTLEDIIYTFYVSLTSNEYYITYIPVYLQTSYKRNVKSYHFLKMIEYIYTNT